MTDPAVMLAVVSVTVLARSPVRRPAAVDDHIVDCYLTSRPNMWDCHDPQCGDSTWDHECPTPPCWIGRSEPVPRP